MRPEPFVRGGIVAALVALPACSTLADSGGGDVALPNAGAGPFREIGQLELGNNRAAPNVLKNDDAFPRDLSVVDTDGDVRTLESWGYVAHTQVADGAEPDPTAPSNAIARYLASDGRSFERQFDVVLEPELDWEADTIGSPCALTMGSEIWLYYATPSGIGLARSPDGLAFQRLDQPVLAPQSDGWERGVGPASPSVVAHPAGGFRMFYEIRRSAEEAAIGEASSPDGVVWQRLGAGPVLAPRDGSVDPRYDDASVGAPHALFWHSAEGRMILWLYYAAEDRAGRRTIGVAARTGADEPFQRAATPVFGSSGSLGPSEPWVMRYEAFALLFVTQRAGSTDSQAYPAVAGGVAPATAVLPPPVSD